MTRLTTLTRKTYSNKARVEFIVAPNEMTKSSIHFTNNKFEAHKAGGYSVTSFWVEKRRRLRGTVEMPESYNSSTYKIPVFMILFGRRLLLENNYKVRFYSRVFNRIAPYWHDEETTPLKFPNAIYERTDWRHIVDQAAKVAIDLWYNAIDADTDVKKAELFSMTLAKNSLICVAMSSPAIMQFATRLADITDIAGFDAKDFYDALITKRTLESRVITEEMVERGSWVESRVLAATLVKTVPTASDMFDIAPIVVEQDDKEEKPAEVDMVAKYAAFYKRNTTGGLFIPKKVTTLFDTIIGTTADAQSSNILMVGPSGCGKTSIPEAFAKKHSMQVLRMNCATVRDPEEWFVYRSAKDGSTVVELTELAETMVAGNVIIILDELNRLEPWMHNTLMPLLDHGREITVLGKKITLGDNVVFVATINKGAKFVGTFSLDSALLNRFDGTLHVDHLTIKQSQGLLAAKHSFSAETINEIVFRLEAVRKMVTRLEEDIDVSTRTLLKIARFVAGGLDVFDAFDYTIFANSDNEVVKDLVDAFKLATVGS